jgi:leader peptidase (prepilin peptidase)/N-methyltransferase
VNTLYLFGLIPVSATGFFGALALIFGLLVGSFLNVCIARMPEDRSVSHPPSHCPSCGSGIRPYDNIPIVSWLLLRGKCRDCQNPISSLYPTIELLTGLIAWLLYRSLIPNVEALDGAHAVAFFFYFSLAAMLIAESFIDIRHYIIPDELSIYAVPYAIGGIALLDWMDYPFSIGAALPMWQYSVLGALFGGGLLLGVALIWRLLRGYDGMGMGDVKLLALIGAVVGPFPGLVFILLLSATSAVLVGLPLSIMSGRGLRSTALPFGPFLALAAILWMLHGPEIVTAYASMMQQIYPGSVVVFG